MIGRLSGLSVSGWLRARSRARPATAPIRLWSHPTKDSPCHIVAYTVSSSYRAAGGWRRFEERGHEVLAPAWPRMESESKHPTRPSVLNGLDRGLGAAGGRLSRSR